MKADRTKVVAFSRVKWSSAHNDPNGARVGRGAKLPGRIFLWASDQLLKLAAATFEKHILGRW